MIVLDEQLQGLGLEAALKRWYRGRVCLITDLRPGMVIKDEMIPRLLRSIPDATFTVTPAVLYAHPFYHANGRLSITGYNLGVLGGI